MRYGGARRAELVRSGRSPEQMARKLEPSSQAIRSRVRESDTDWDRRADGLSTAGCEGLGRLGRHFKQIEKDGAVLAGISAWFAWEFGPIPSGSPESRECTGPCGQTQRGAAGGRSPPAGARTSESVASAPIGRCASGRRRASSLVEGSPRPAESAMRRRPRISRATRLALTDRTDSGWPTPPRPPPGGGSFIFSLCSIQGDSGSSAERCAGLAAPSSGRRRPPRLSRVSGPTRSAALLVSVKPLRGPGPFTELQTTDAG